MGEPNEIKPGKGEFHEHPMDCICARTNRRTGHSKPYLSNRVGEAAGNHTSDAEFDWSDLDYGENTPLGGDSSNETDPNYSHIAGPDIAELEDIISD